MRQTNVFFLFIFFVFSIGNHLCAQSILSRKVSLDVVSQPLGKVMTALEQKGKFGFSYNSKTVPRDSLVSISVGNVTIKEALDLLFEDQFEYKETKNFIILRYAPLRIAFVIEEARGDNESYFISGYVTEKGSSKGLYQASVYEKSLAKGTLTGENGYFEIRLHDIYQPIALTASKENYKDATSLFLKEVNIKKVRTPKVDSSDLDFNNIAGKGLAKFLTSAKQQVQSINLAGIISQAPYQVSLIPAINTHGTFSGQVVNELSLNLLGGYNAGADGVEIGGFFNINKMNTNGVQLAGLFNITGGSVRGIQLSGLYNDVLHDADGIQLSGIKNNIQGSRRGLQIAGVFNAVKKNSSGIQIAGLFNDVSGNVSGLQLAGVLNRAGTSTGFQLGLINIADSSTGYSLGLLNFIGNGFNKVSVGYNETIDLNAVLRTGTNKLYTMWLAGANIRKDNKLYALGLGMGKTAKITNWLTLSPEVSCRYLYGGNWKYTNLLNRLDLSLNFRLSNALAITTGPSLNIYYSDQERPENNYAYVLKRSDSFGFNNNKLRGWVGWGAAITVF